MALQPTPPEDRSYDRARTSRKRASSLCHVGHHAFHPLALRVVPEWPLVYWWDNQTLDRYVEVPKLGDVSDVRTGLTTCDNVRFTRQTWEPGFATIAIAQAPRRHSWVPTVMGGKGRAWLEPLLQVLRWQHDGLEQKVFQEWHYRAVSKHVRSPEKYFVRGIAFSMIGDSFVARAHRFPSVFGSKGSSVFPSNIGEVLCQMNCSFSRSVLQSLNPGIGFEVGDVNRLPLVQIEDSGSIFKRIDAAFSIHESHREPSVEFRPPGPSPWRCTQDWAQLAVDRPHGEPLPVYVEELDPEPSTDHVSFALGVALGRFGASGEGILDPSKDDLSETLPDGICFLDGSLENGATGNSLDHGAAELLHTKWAEYGRAVDSDTDLCTWLRLKFFGDVHKGMYENRPIYFPVSSEKKTFVAYVSIHRWTEDTLRALLAEHLHPALTRLEGEIVDLRESRQSVDKRIAREAERRYDQVAKWKQELDDFIAKVAQCAEKGPPPPDAKTPAREVDARYAPNLDDGVMINSAALWPLLEPQWKDPKKWWKELATAKGKKDYDWAHLVACYFPNRVDEKCKEDPSLGVAHGCFWKYQPRKCLQVGASAAG